VLPTECHRGEQNAFPERASRRPPAKRVQGDRKHRDRFPDVLAIQISALVTLLERESLVAGIFMSLFMSLTSTTKRRPKRPEAREERRKGNVLEEIYIHMRRGARVLWRFANSALS
jgi:hypothetical protein